MKSVKITNSLREDKMNSKKQLFRCVAQNYATPYNKRQASLLLRLVHPSPGFKRS